MCILPIILEVSPGQWVCLAHLVPTICTEVLLKCLMNQGVGESEPRYLFSFPSYLRVTNGNVVMLTFTSAEEIFSLFSTEAIKLNFSLLGSLPRRRHRRLLHPVYEGFLKVKTPEFVRAQGDCRWSGEPPCRCPTILLSTSHHSTSASAGKKNRVCVDLTLVLSREQNDLFSGNKLCLM